MSDFLKKLFDLGFDDPEGQGHSHNWQYKVVVILTTVYKFESNTAENKKNIEMYSQ